MLSGYDTLTADRAHMSNCKAGWHIKQIPRCWIPFGSVCLCWNNSCYFPDLIRVNIWAARYANPSPNCPIYFPSTIIFNLHMNIPLKSRSLISKHDWGAQARWHKWLEEEIFCHQFHRLITAGCCISILQVSAAVDTQCQRVCAQSSHGLGFISWNTNINALDLCMF